MASNRVWYRCMKVVSWLPVYTAIIATLTFLLILFGVPYVGGI